MRGYFNNAAHITVSVTNRTNNREMFVELREITGSLTSRVVQSWTIPAGSTGHHAANIEGTRNYYLLFRAVGPFQFDGNVTRILSRQHEE